MILNCVEGLTLWEGIWEKGGSDRNWHLGSGQREKQDSNCFQKPMSECPFQVHLCRSFLDFISCRTNDCFPSLNYSCDFVLPRGRNSRINWILWSKWSFSEHLWNHVSYGSLKWGRRSSSREICHITYSPSFYFFTLRTAYSSSESSVFFLWNNAWKVPRSITLRLTLWTGTAEMKHLGLKRLLSARPQGHTLKTRILQSSAHIFPLREEYILNGYMILNAR